MVRPPRVRAPILAALVGLVAMIAISGGALAAQEPEPQDTAAQEPRAQEPREQEREQEAPDTGAVATAAAAYRPPRLSVSVTIGGLGDRPIQSQPVLAQRRDADGTVLETTLLGRSMDAEGGLEAGLAGTLSLGPTWAIRVGAALGRTTFNVDYSGEDETFLAAADHLATLETVDVTIVSLEAALRMRIPSSRHAQPYLEIGAASMTWRGSSPLAGAADLENGMHRVAGTAAAGMIVPLRNRLAGRIHASARTYRTPVGLTPAGVPGAGSSTLQVAFEPPETRPFGDPALELTTALRLDLGLSMGIGGGSPATPDS